LTGRALLTCGTSGSLDTLDTRHYFLDSRYNWNEREMEDTFYVISSFLSCSDSITLRLVNHRLKGIVDHQKIPATDAYHALQTKDIPACIHVLNRLSHDDVKTCCSAIRFPELLYHIYNLGVDLDLHDVPDLPDMIRTFREIYPDYIVRTHHLEISYESCLEILSFKNIEVEYPEILDWRVIIALIDRDPKMLTHRLLKKLISMYIPNLTEALITRGMIPSDNIMIRQYHGSILIQWLNYHIVDRSQIT
jgi:hypothetical protein